VIDETGSDIKKPSSDEPRTEHAQQAEIFTTETTPKDKRTDSQEHAEASSIKHQPASQSVGNQIHGWLATVHDKPKGIGFHDWVTIAATIAIAASTSAPRQGEHPE
jgi:hypothetical protein